MTPAKHINDVVGKMATLGRYQEYEKQAAAKRGPDFAKRKGHGIKAYADVSKNTDLITILPAGIVQELNRQHTWSLSTTSITISRM